jgi:hypothetical protein
MGIVLSVMTLYFTILLIFPNLFGLKSFVLYLILLLLLMSEYIIFIPAIDKNDNRKKICKALIKIGFIESILFIVLAPMRKLQYISDSGAFLSISILFAVVIIILCIAFCLSDIGKSFFDKLESGCIPSISEKKMINDGDVVLCEIKEELEKHSKDAREILPFKDRFLHMLILGPTGCGKTSQILLPMVNQDIQNLGCGITVLEPKGDFAIKAAMMAKHYGRDYIYFDPSYKNCPKFNPLSGREVDVVENMATTFRMLNPDSPQFFLDLNEQLMRNSVKVLKRLDREDGIEGKYANLINLSRLLQNSGGQGRELVNEFTKIGAPTEAEAKENSDIATWFLNDYFPERSKVYENTSGVRSQVSKLVSNEYLREVLNPDVNNGETNDINFDKHLAEGGIICISTAQGALGDLSKYLGYFIILSFQSSVFRRPGNENTRRPHFLYIDEFQTYSTPGFSNMLTQGRSYRVGSILATQARAQMAMGGGRDGKNFVELVSANARNIVLFPGINKDDAKYYSEQFGESEQVEKMVGYSRKIFNPLTGGLDKLGHPTESVREMKKMTANFSTTDLIFGQEQGKSFGEMTYSIIKNSSVQPAKVGKISYIDKELNDKLDAEIEQYNDAFARESAAEFYTKKDVKPLEEEGLSFTNVIGGEDELEDLAAGAEDMLPDISSGDENDNVEVVQIFNSDNLVQNNINDHDTKETVLEIDDDIAFVDEDIHEDLTKDDIGHNEQDDWDIDDLF